ncbi:MAG: hypothetical protein P0Y64_00420 [Candidatus Sphingomonas colombiensis]|nr:hypothetical protein [Sphingomonas sp.]WEK43363.1 MAG: hypothetical protein P0Y64_00420 [Sphingomonas sp.]
MLADSARRLNVERCAEGRLISITGEAELKPQSIVVPGDPSSAAFWLVAALDRAGQRRGGRECRHEPDPQRDRHRAAPDGRDITEI